MRHRRTSLTFKKSKSVVPAPSPDNDAPSSIVGDNVHLDSSDKPQSKSKVRLFSLSVVRKISSCIRNNTITRTPSPSTIPIESNDDLTGSSTGQAIKGDLPNAKLSSLLPVDSGYSTYFGKSEPSETTQPQPSASPITSDATRESETAPVSCQQCDRHENNHVDITASLSSSGANSNVDNRDSGQKAHHLVDEHEPDDFEGSTNHEPLPVTNDESKNFVARHPKEFELDCPPNDANGFYQFGTPNPNHMPTGSDNGRLRRIFSENLLRNGSVSSRTNGRPWMESVRPSEDFKEGVCRLVDVPTKTVDEIQQSVACDTLKDSERNAIPHLASSSSKIESFKGGIISPLPTVHSFPILNQTRDNTSHVLPSTPLPGRKSQLFSIMWSKRKGGLVLEVDDEETSIERHGKGEHLWSDSSVLIKGVDWADVLEETKIEEEDVLDILDMYMPDAHGRENYSYSPKFKRPVAPAGFI